MNAKQRRSVRALVSAGAILGLAACGLVIREEAVPVSSVPAPGAVAAPVGGATAPGSAAPVSISQPDRIYYVTTTSAPAPTTTLFLFATTTAPVPFDPAALANRIRPGQTPLCTAADETVLASTSILNLGSTSGSRPAALDPGQRSQAINYLRTFRSSATTMMGLLDESGLLDVRPSLISDLSSLSVSGSSDPRDTLRSFIDGHGADLNEAIVAVSASCPDGLLVDLRSDQP